MTKYSFKCSDLGMECPFTVTAESREAVKKHAEMHGMDNHADMMNSMSEEDKAAFDTKMDSLIQESSM